MAPTSFTPRQIAAALGVSESSVKRWIDSGKLQAARTAGGHRKAPLSSIVEFIRETGHSIEDPDVLGMVAVVQRRTLESAIEPLFAAALAGEEAPCRELILGFYQQGESLADLGDRLIGPVMRRVGDGWEAGEVQVFQERRACEVLDAALYELRRWLPPAPADSPLATIATPEQDFSEVPARLLELVLIERGWSVRVLGSGLPLEEIRAGVLRLSPRIACLSVTHLVDAETFADRYNSVLVEPTRQLAEPPLHAIGGSAIPDEVVADLRCDLAAGSLADLVAYQEKIAMSRAG